jgi:hypothetical protein
MLTAQFLRTWSSLYTESGYEYLASWIPRELDQTRGGCWTPRRWCWRIQFLNRRSWRAELLRREDVTVDTSDAAPLTEAVPTDASEDVFCSKAGGKIGKDPRDPQTSGPEWVNWVTALRGPGWVRPNWLLLVTFAWESGELGLGYSVEPCPASSAICRSSWPRSMKYYLKQSMFSWGW